MNNEEYEYVKATVDDFWGKFPVVVYNGCEYKVVYWSEDYIHIKSSGGMKLSVLKDQINNSRLYIKKKKPTSSPSKKYVQFNLNEWGNGTKQEYEDKIFQKDNLNTPVNVFLLINGDIVFGHDKHNMAIATKEEAEEQLVVLKEKKERWVNVYYDEKSDEVRVGRTWSSEQAAHGYIDSDSGLVTTLKVEL